MEIEKRLERYSQLARSIIERLNYVHPSGPVIFAEWYPLPDPIWVPKRLCDEKRALVLDLNGLLVTVVEPRFGEKPPAYADEMLKYDVLDKQVFCRKDSHFFLDWCLQFFNVFIWSTSLSRKVMSICNTIFPEQVPKITGFFSQAHCTQRSWQIQRKPVFMKDLSLFWKHTPGYNAQNTLIIDNSFYKVFQNPPQTWLVTPSLGHQSAEQREKFLTDTLKSWLFLWLQTDDREAYVADNVFDTGSDEFSDAVVIRLLDIQKKKVEAERQEALQRKQREADLEAEKKEKLERERKQREADLEAEEEAEIKEELKRKVAAERKEKRQQEEDKQQKAQPGYYKRPPKRPQGFWGQ